MKKSKPLNSPSVSVHLNQMHLDLRFNPKDILMDASLWGEDLPEGAERFMDLIKNKSIENIESLLFDEVDKLDEEFSHDNIFSLKRFVSFHGDQFFSSFIELLKMALDLYRGKIKENEDELHNPLVCRCFGVFESDIINYLNTSESPSLEDIGEKLKAGSGCRSCRVQLKKWLPSISSTQGKDLLLDRSHHYLNKSNTEWILEIDLVLSHFPLSASWKMEVQDFQLGLVTISYDRDVSQEEEERVGEELQDFLSQYTSKADQGDQDGQADHFSFFLVRRRHR